MKEGGRGEGRDGNGEKGLLVEGDKILERRGERGWDKGRETGGQGKYGI